MDVGREPWRTTAHDRRCYHSNESCIVCACFAISETDGKSQGEMIDCVTLISGLALMHKRVCFW